MNNTQINETQKLGTTIMSIIYQGGVIACADSSYSFLLGSSISSIYVHNRATDKIDYIHDRIFCLRSGDASQSTYAIRKVRNSILMHSIQLGNNPHVKTASRMLQSINYQKSLNASFIVAGWDPYQGPQVIQINLNGAMISKPYAISGSGSAYIYSYCDSNYKPYMTFEQARQFCITAVSLAMYRDGSSGGIIRLLNITQKGVSREYIDRSNLPYK